MPPDNVPEIGYRCVFKPQLLLSSVLRGPGWVRAVVSRPLAGSAVYASVIYEYDFLCMLWYFTNNWGRTFLSIAD